MTPPLDGEKLHEFFTIKAIELRPLSRLHFQNDNDHFCLEVRIANQTQTSIPFLKSDLSAWSFNFDMMINGEENIEIGFSLLIEDSKTARKFDVIAVATFMAQLNNSQNTIFLYSNESNSPVCSLCFSIAVPLNFEADEQNCRLQGFSPEDFCDNQILSDQEKMEFYDNFAQDLEKVSQVSKAVGGLDSRPPSPTITAPLKVATGASKGVVGLVSLEIVAAQSLPRERKTIRIYYENNPFVVICFGKQTFRTKVVKRTLNPIWKERLYFTVKEIEASYYIIFSVYDYDRFGQNTCIGTTNIRASLLLSAPNQVQKLALNLITGSGNNSNFDTASVSEACLLVKACFVPYETLRKNFWRILARQYDSNDDDRLNRIELKAMLDSIGSTLHDSTIDRIMSKAPNGVDVGVSQIAEALEEMTLRIEAADPTDNNFSLIRAESMESIHESVVRLEECPICGSRMNGQQMDLDVVTHLAFCASRDVAKLDRVVMGGFLTEEYASRKWFVRLFSFMSFGGYRIGKNNGNILVQDRRTGKLLEEKIPTYIRLGIRMMAQSPATDWNMARQLFQTLTIKQGRRFNDPNSVRNIPDFISYHNINMDEVEVPHPGGFRTFNDFFYRKLKPGSRQLASPDPRVAVCPADSRLLVFPTVGEATRLWIKGSAFTMSNLLRDDSLGAYFGDGPVAVCRLAPQDYHRFHSPVDGDLTIYYHIPGTYMTVNPMAVRQRLDVFTENVGTVFLIDSLHHGKVAVVAVGAMMVGSVVVTVGGDRDGRQKGVVVPLSLSISGGHAVKRMDELGYFAFGGSTIIVAFAPGRITFDPDLVINSQEPLETLVQMGSSLGVTGTTDDPLTV